MVVEVPSDLKVVALFAITLLVWWHFPPPLFHFDGTFRHHDFFHSDLSGGAFCRHFAVLTVLFAPTFGTFCLHTFSALICAGALSAPTLWFWGRFLPPYSCFGGTFRPHLPDSPIQLSLLPFHSHPISHFLLHLYPLPASHLFQAVYPLHPVHLSQNPLLPLHNPFLLQP